jgi:3-oxoacyl-[acyl-carrier-protein] synthase II
VTAAVITHWSAVSPYGLGAAAFTDGVRSGRTTAAGVDLGRWRSPEGQACLVPGFDIEELLGRKGSKSLDRLSGLALVALGELPAEQNTDHTAFVFGTTTGSAHSAMDFTRTSLTATRPTHVDPARVPSCILNFAAGQCAIRAGFRGPNATIAGGRAAALLGLGYGARLLASGRADVVLCASAEEYSADRAWLEHQRWGRTVLGEGAVVFRMEASPHGVADLLGITSRVWTGGIADVLRPAVLDLLARTGVRPADVASVALAGFSVTGEERDVLTELFPGTTLAEHADTVGDSGAVAAGFALAATLTAEETAAGGLALVTAVDPDGQFSVALFRVNGG